ncbi:MAG: contractile injection system protein, VgrG/Pvc8 family, partial [Saezia sp.]
MAQKNLRFSFEVIPSGDGEDDNSSPIQLDVLSFTLEEKLNSGFVLDIELVSFNHAIDFNSVVDKPALFTVWNGSQAVRHIHGLVSDFEQGKTGKRRTFYKAKIESVLSRTFLTSDWRIFQEQSAEQVLSAMLKANHIDNFEINSLTSHTPRRYLVQPGVLDGI